MPLPAPTDKLNVLSALELNQKMTRKEYEQELEKCPVTKLGLLDFCAKAEKFIYVFIDTARARPVAELLRTIVEEPLP